MIAFDLNCSNGHRFEGWFASSEDYSKQQSSGLLACPVCDDMTVQKALSVPHVPKKGNQRSGAVPIAAEPAKTDALPPAVVVQCEAPCDILIALPHAQLLGAHVRDARDDLRLRDRHVDALDLRCRLDREPLGGQ